MDVTGSTKLAEVQSSNAFYQHIVQSPSLLAEIMPVRSARFKRTFPGSILEKKLCRCDSKPQSSERRSIWGLKIITKTRLHHSSCPASSLGPKSTAITFNAGFSPWGRRLAITTIFSSTAPGGGNWLSQFSMKVRPVINWKASPVMLPLHQFWIQCEKQKLSGTAVELKFQTMLSRLNSFFLARKATVLDRDQHDNSLLDVSLSFEAWPISTNKM
jgi:hypothetical protein